MLSSRAAAFSVEALLIGGQEHNEEGPHHPLTVEENSIHDPADNDPTTHEPATNEPITLDPATHKPTDHDPDTHKPTAHEPDTHKPTAHDPETHKPTAHDPETHKPTAHDPDTHKQATHDLVTLDSSAMVQSNDTRGEMSLEESEQSVKGDSQCGSTPPPQHTTLDTHTTQDDNLTHQEAVVQSAQGNTERRASELSTDDDRDTDDEELVVDVESCTTPPPHSPDESSTGVALSSDTPVTPMCHSRCRSPIGLSTQHQFREETFPSASPTGAAEWQVFSPTCGVSVGWGGQEGVEEGRGGVTIQLLQHDLWAKFHSLSTEMIITKNGRRMFPVVKMKLRGLDPEKTYMVYLDMVAVDTRRYRYVYPSSRWMVAGTGEPLSDQPPYIHPDSPSSGVQWMAAPAVAFDRLKLTNNKTRDAKGQIILHSMQKYRPRLWVQEVSVGSSWADLPRLTDPRHAHHASFPETTFITVTAYQNQQITRLKIDSNPFAKGFRDTSKQKELLERRPQVHSSRTHEATSVVPSTLMLPLRMPVPPLQYVSPLAGFSSLSCPVSPPVSPLLLPPHWLSGALDGGDRPLPWVPELSTSPFLRSATSGLPFLLPPILPAFHTQLPHALDLSKRKDNT